MDSERLMLDENIRRTICAHTAKAANTILGRLRKYSGYHANVIRAAEALYTAATGESHENTASKPNSNAETTASTNMLYALLKHIVQNAIALWSTPARPDLERLLPTLLHLWQDVEATLAQDLVKLELESLSPMSLRSLGEKVGVEVQSGDEMQHKVFHTLSKSRTKIKDLSEAYSKTKNRAELEFLAREAGISVKHRDLQGVLSFHAFKSGKSASSIRELIAHIQDPTYAQSLEGRIQLASLSHLKEVCAKVPSCKSNRKDNRDFMLENIALYKAELLEAFQAIQTRTEPALEDRHINDLINETATYCTLIRFAQWAKVPGYAATKWQSKLKGTAAEKRLASFKVFLITFFETNRDNIDKAKNKLTELLISAAFYKKRTSKRKAILDDGSHSGRDDIEGTLGDNNSPTTILKQASSRTGRRAAKQCKLSSKDEDEDEEMLDAAAEDDRILSTKSLRPRKAGKRIRSEGQDEEMPENTAADDRSRPKKRALRQKKPRKAKQRVMYNEEDGEMLDKAA